MAIKIKKIDLRRIQFSIKGESPLIQHAWSEKGKAQLRMTAQERKKVEKTKRDPEQSALDATYFMPDGTTYGFPLLAFKAALISAAHKDLGLEKTLLKKAFFIPCDNKDNLVPLKCTPPEVREDVVRIGANQTDLRYRPEFKEWSVDIVADVDFGSLTEENLVNLINRAGFGVGVCEWRPEKGGEFGRFKIDESVPMTNETLEW